MPNLRLSDQEAADAAAFLAEDKNDQFTQNVPVIDNDILDDVVRVFLFKENTVAQTKSKLDSMRQEEKLQYAGKKLIGQYGCYSCHNISGFENYKPIGTELTAEGSKSVDKLDFGFIDIPHTRQAWFAQKLKDPRIFDRQRVRSADEKLRMPNFYFTDQEVEAITTAILGFVDDHPGKIPEQTVQAKYIAEGQQLIKQFNCQGCHIIEGAGGSIQPTVTKFLQMYEGKDEGEAVAVTGPFSPPNLIGEGKKVQPQWLFEFLHQPKTIRPWLTVRMPTYSFDSEQLNTIIKYFNALDNEPLPFPQIVDTHLTPEEYQAGEKLFSKDYFACAKCHIVGDTLPSGSPENWAPNFALAKERLKPEWLRQWILNPQDLLPGTKMPTFYDPEYFADSGPSDILNGDENMQIRILTNYILSLTDHTEEAPKDKKAAPTKGADASPVMDVQPDSDPVRNAN